jgi:hypothetical protein
MHAVLKKMFYKGQGPVLLLNAPAEFKAVAKDLADPRNKVPKGKAPFALAFAASQAEAKKAAAAVNRALAEDGSFWLAYPKGTSKKYKGADINRDSGHALLGTLGFDGVSLVAIDEDWSAMRFKRKA